MLAKKSNFFFLPARSLNTGIEKVYTDILRHVPVQTRPKSISTQSRVETVQSPYTYQIHSRVGHP